MGKSAWNCTEKFNWVNTSKTLLLFCKMLNKLEKAQNCTANYWSCCCRWCSEFQFITYIFFPRNCTYFRYFRCLLAFYCGWEVSQLHHSTFPCNRERVKMYKNLMRLFVHLVWFRPTIALNLPQILENT